MARKSVLVSVVLVALLVLGAAAWWIWWMFFGSAAPDSGLTVRSATATQEPGISLRLLRAETPAGLNGPTRYTYQVEGISLRDEQLAQVTVTPRGDGTVNRNENLLFAFIPSEKKKAFRKFVSSSDSIFSYSDFFRKRIPSSC